MGTVERLLSSVELPEMVSVRQKFDDTHIPVEEIPDVVKTQLDRTEIKEKINCDHGGKPRCCQHSGYHKSNWRLC